jgi:hypothetical protein
MAAKKMKDVNPRECMSNGVLSNFILDMGERARKKKEVSTRKRISQSIDSTVY